MLPCHSSSLREIKAGTEAEAMGKCYWLICSLWVAPFHFMYTPGPPAWGVALPTVDWALLCQLTINKILLQAHWWKTFLFQFSVHFFLLRIDSSLCWADKELTRTPASAIYCSLSCMFFYPWIAVWSILCGLTVFVLFEVYWTSSIWRIFILIKFRKLYISSVF